jgi:hypothetical protein
VARLVASTVIFQEFNHARCLRKLAPLIQALDRDPLPSTISAVLLRTRENQKHDEVWRRRCLGSIAKLAEGQIHEAKLFIARLNCNLRLYQLVDDHEFQRFDRLKILRRDFRLGDREIELGFDSEH